MSPRIGVEPSLHPIPLVARFPPRVLGEAPKIIQRAAQECDRLHVLSYIDSDMMDRIYGSSLPSPLLRGLRRLEITDCKAQGPSAA